MFTGSTGYWWWWFMSAQVKVARSWKYKVSLGLFVMVGTWVVLGLGRVMLFFGYLGHLLSWISDQTSGSA